MTENKDKVPIIFVVLDEAVLDEIASRGWPPMDVLLWEEVVTGQQYEVPEDVTGEGGTRE
jgi:hypothetical protein